MLQPYLGSLLFAASVVGKTRSVLVEPDQSFSFSGTAGKKYSPTDTRGAMSVEAKLGRQAIGAAGELFLQYQLIKRGIDSARLTTDSGIDLVMYVPGSREAHTIQVKATNTNYPNGPGTSPQLWWIFPRTCKAQWLAVVDLTRDRAWLLPIEDALREARGNDSKGNTNLQWYIGEKPKRAIHSETDFDRYQLDAAIDRLLGTQTPELP